MTESVVVVGGRLSRGSDRPCVVGVVLARGELDIVQGEMHHCSIVDWTVATLEVQAHWKDLGKAPGDAATGPLWNTCAVVGAALF